MGYVPGGDPNMSFLGLYIYQMGYTLGDTRLSFWDLYAWKLAKILVYIAWKIGG